MNEYKIYAIIKISIEELNKEYAKKVVDLNYETVFKSTDAAEIIRKLDELKATDSEYSVEEYTENEDGDYVEGGDYDTPSNFRKRNA